MSRTFWRWEERDFGFRFRAGTGRDAREYYQARMPGSFYIVPASQRKFTKDRMEKLATLANAPASPRVVANPWRHYGRHWDWIVAEDGSWPRMESALTGLAALRWRRSIAREDPFITDDDDEVFRYTSEVMNELLALHPFREGNGRTAFIVGNLILMQNDMLPLAAYERRTDEARFYDACEAGRISKNYVPLATLLTEWEDRALTRWREAHG